MNLADDFKIEDLDNIKIMDDKERVAACFGMMFTFYLQKTHEKSVRRKMAECLEEYRTMAAGKLKWYLPPPGGQYRAVKKGRPVSLVEDLEKKYTPQKGYCWVFSGGDSYEDAAPYGVEMMSLADYGGDDIGYVSGNLPMAWIEQNGPGSFQKLVHKWCAKLNPFHGYAGLGVIQSIDYDANRRTKLIILPYAMRFPGLEVENSASLSWHLTQKIKGVNWLTVLCDDFINQLGGREKLKETLGEEFPFFDYQGGSIIQAGPTPQIGDVNRNIIPEHYQKLSKVLKPIRVDYKDSFLRAEDPSQNREVTKKWFNRFD